MVKNRSAGMRFLSCARVPLFILALVSATMLLPLGFALAYGEGALVPVFALPIPVCGLLALLAFHATRGMRFNITVRQGYLIVASCWVSVSLLGAVPFLVSGAIPNIPDAIFESVSGVTTTGATILSNPEGLPVSLGLWRCQLHWLGGLGIIALTVALMPVLGIGGFQLIKAETSGPEKSKITAKITTTAQILWILYIALTAAQTLALLAAGMNFPDALAHAFSTIGTGGFSTRNASIGAWDSPAIRMTCAVFMALAGVNFALYHALFVRQFAEVRDNTELKVYLGILLLATAAITVLTLPQTRDLSVAAQSAFFHVASITSTTGFATTDYMLWVPGAQTVLLALMCVGGCSGSTAGGVKVIRWVVLFKQIGNQFRTMLHPRGVFRVRINKRVGRKDLVYAVSAFMFLYLAAAAVTAFVAALGGADLTSALSSSLSIMGNVGLGLEKVGPAGNYAFFPGAVKLWFSLMMLAGRLELFTLFLLFLPATWKKYA